MDRNPKFGVDVRFAEDARRVADFLWENSGGNVSAFPRSYLENLRHDYADGRVSMLELIDRVDLGPDATYEEYCEVFDALLEVDPDQWPDPDSVTMVQTETLLQRGSSESFAEVSFAEGDENMSYKIEKFLKKVLASVYTSGVTEVTDKDGNPPGESNNYLLSDDGEEFHGVFYDRGQDEKTKKFPFRIFSNNGRWSVEY